MSQIRRSVSALLCLLLAATALSTTTADATTSAQRAAWVPASGVVFNTPTIPSARNVIIKKVLDSVRETAPGEYIRLVTWNFDDKPGANALIDAFRRGVNVQIVVSGVVDNDNWTRLKGVLNDVKGDESFARQCHGGCRSNSKIMHSKIYLFSRVHTARNISMFGSSNLTRAAASHQWNDMTTTYNEELYTYLLGVFDQYAADEPVPGSAYEVHTAGRYRVTLFPLPDGTNPMFQELRKVRCKGVTGGAGNGHGRTKIRIAVAGWFDSFGDPIARRVRTLWDHGCDVKIVATSVGGGIKRILKSGAGRGPIPIRDLSPDRNNDGIPELYLHMKSMAISGVYDGNTAGRVVFTGSPNWSSRAARSEEIWVRMLGLKGITRRYLNRVDALYKSNQASAMDSFSSPTTRAFRTGARTQAMPDWFEND